MIQSSAVREVREMADRYYSIPGSEGEAAALHAVLGDLAATQKRLTETETVVNGLRDDLEQQDAQLSAELDATRAEIAEQAAEIISERQAAARHTRDTLGLAAKCDDLRAQLLTQSEELGRVRAELDALHHVADERTRERDAARAEITELRAELAAAESTIRAWEDPDLRAALVTPTTGDHGPVPDPARKDDR